VTHGLPLALTPGLPLGPQPCNPLSLGREPKAKVATVSSLNENFNIFMGGYKLINEALVTSDYGR